MLYAAQFRDMHTAIHNLVIYPVRSKARQALCVLHQEQTAEHVPPFEALAEINFRSPPTTFKGQRLTIVNNDLGLPTGVPDVY